MAQSFISSKTKSNEDLPPNIPHNETILIPNHYSMRATSSNEYTAVECDVIKKKLSSREKSISVSSTGIIKKYFRGSAVFSGHFI